MSAKQQLIKEIAEAIVFLREENKTIPTETIEFIKQAAMDKVNPIVDPANKREVDIAYIKEKLGYSGAIGEGYMADNLIVYSMFDNETRELITEIHSEGVSVTKYYQEVEGESEHYDFDELGTPTIGDISKIVEGWLENHT